MKITAARRAGLDALASVYPEYGRISNVTSPGVGYVYWQTANWLIEREFAYQPDGGLAAIALTARGVDVVNGLPQCRECGCTENSSCGDGCSWVEPDLCSACVVAT